MILSLLKKVKGKQSPTRYMGNGTQENAPKSGRVSSVLGREGSAQGPGCVSGPRSTRPRSTRGLRARGLRARGLRARGLRARAADLRLCGRLGCGRVADHRLGRDLGDAGPARRVEHHDLAADLGGAVGADATVAAVDLQATRLDVV